MTAMTPTDTASAGGADVATGRPSHERAPDGRVLDDAAPSGSRLRWFLTLSLRPVLLFVASRAGMLVVACATSSVTHRPVSTSLTVWDSSWYLSIAGGGYVQIGRAHV
jgi:hypothetical protein